MNKGFWRAKGHGSLGDGDMAYDNSSRIEPKRPPQWFMDGTEAEFFPNKKQAVEVPNNSSFSEFLNSNASPWGNASSFHSVASQFTERQFDPETARTINFDDKNEPSSVGTDIMNMERKVLEDPFEIDSSFGLSISHSLEDPRLDLNYGRKVKVSQVKELEDFMSVSMKHAYTREDNNIMSTLHSYSKADANSITMGLSFNSEDDNMISMGDTYNREGSNFISMGQPFNKGDNTNLSSHHTYKENNSAISIGQSLSKDDSNISTMGQTFTKGDGHSISMGHNFEENVSAVSMGQPFSKDGSSFTSMGQSFNKGDDNTISMGRSYNKENDNAVLGHTYNKVDNNNLSMGHSFNKGEGNIISFGGFNDDDDINPSGRLICSYNLLMGQTSVQRPAAPSENELIESHADALISATQSVSGETVLKKKEEQKAAKKAPPNNFPSNVRSLLSTGILDGVPVKYVAWSREELRGIIKGSGYLCGCQSCSFSKAVNAYEFERHAGCKTKHPNNHIYFENGKTIYAIVQELRNTPQNLLFDVIQTITGSTINQKSFRLWKESFLAATRELQRIYGKEEGKRLS